jgi:K+-sensing histidine kinase KdpD
MLSKFIPYTFLTYNSLRFIEHALEMPKQSTSNMPNGLVYGWPRAPRRLRVLGQCLAGCAGLAILTFYGAAFRVYLPIMSFLYLLVVATLGGFWPASRISFAAATCLDYFFTLPLYHFEIADPQDWVALATFEVTAIVISRLSAKELRNAREPARASGCLW